MKHLLTFFVSLTAGLTVAFSQCETTMPVVILGDTSLCTGESTTLYLEGDWFAYSWSNGSASQSITTDFPQTYCVSVTDVEGCTGTACVNVSAFDIEIETVGDDVICSGEEVTLYVTGSADIDAFIWSTGSSSDTLVVGMPGIYCVTVTSLSGCVDTTCFRLWATPNITLPDYLTVCEGESFILPCHPEFSQCILNGIPLDDPVEVLPGFHTLEIIDTHGCSHVSEFVLEIIPLIVVVIDTTLCEGDTLHCAGLIIREDIMDLVVNAGQNSAGCDSIIVINATFEDLMITDTVTGDFVKGKGAIHILNITGGTIPYTYQWNTGSPDPAIRNLYSGTYTVTITDAIGCEEVRVYEAGPGGFTGKPDSPVDISDDPLRGETIVTSRFSLRHDWRIDVYNILGAHVSGTEHDGPEQVTIPRSHPGVYIYVISDGSGILTTYRRVY